VAVSGGGDSIALLHLTQRLAVRRRLHLTVAHLDHALRRGSGADRRFVEQAAADLSLPIITDRRPVSALRRKDESPEEAARRVRRGFLLEAAQQVDAAVIATGHTLDDQAETVLMRLVRGAGPAALAGIAVAGPGPFVRPLLGIERAELRALLESRGLRYRDDPSNLARRHDRNRVRNLILPLLSEVLNPKAARHLVEAARRLREDAEHLDAEAHVIFERMVRTGATKGVSLDAGELRATAAPIARRLARLALLRAGCDPRRISSRHVEALLGLAGGAGGKTLCLPTGVLALKRKGSLILGPASSAEDFW